MTRRVTNLGSCCIDNVYQVPHFVQPGETLPCLGFDIFPGGKGLNQSIALARAGADVRHAGRVGRDGEWLKSLLIDAGVDTGLLQVTDAASGHAVIQIEPGGENAIVTYGGANRDMTADDFAQVIGSCEPGEILLLQNEINDLDAIMAAAKSRDISVVFNAAPMTDDVLALPLGAVSCFIVNELEGEALTGAAQPQQIVDELLARFPRAQVVLTLGKQGVLYGHGDTRIEQPGFAADAVDTTGAGDTFTGYFVAGLAAGDAVRDCLRLACRAAAVSVTRAGAASSIPLRDELS